MQNVRCVALLVSTIGAMFSKIKHRMLRDVH